MIQDCQTLPKKLGESIVGASPRGFKLIQIRTVLNESLDTVIEWNPGIFMCLKACIKGMVPYVFLLQWEFCYLIDPLSF